MRSREWMKGALFGFVIAAAAGAGVGAMANDRVRAPTQVIVDRDILDRGIDQAIADLDALEQLNNRSRDRKTRARIDKRVDEIRRSLQGLEQSLAAAQPYDDDVYYGDGRDRDGRRGDRDRWRDRDRDRDRDRRDERADDRQSTYALTEAELVSLIDSMNASSQSQGKIAIVRDGVNGRWITCAQLIRIMEELAFSSDRVDVAVLLYNNISDPQSFHTVYGHLPFEADRDELRKRLGK